MSGPDFCVLAVALACCALLGWCLSLARRLRRIERTSKLDSLTSLGSGDWLLTERWPAALRSGQPLGVLYLDLDHLKWTNDTKGHGAGDQYIRTAAEVLRQSVRRGVDEVFRSHRAGDEFEVLLLGPLADPRGRAEALLQRLSERGVSASVGLAYTTERQFVPPAPNCGSGPRSPAGKPRRSGAAAPSSPFPVRLCPRTHWTPSASTPGDRCERPPTPAPCSSSRSRPKVFIHER